MSNTTPNPSVTLGISGSELGASSPVDLSPAQQQAAAAGTSAAAVAAPTQIPPSVAGADAASFTGGTTAWQNGKKISALWVINEVRNSWAYITGIGWKKFANKSDSAIVALTTLGAHAKLLQSSVNYRDEADGMIHEMYVW